MNNKTNKTNSDRAEKRSERHEYMVNKTVRYFGEGNCVGSDSRVTHLNNNDLVIGASGAGKTGSYVIPYINHSDESFLVADTKCNLYTKCKDDLERRGYKVYNIDLIDPARGEGYNPLSYIPKRTVNGVEKYDEKEIMSISNTMIPITDTRDAFWVMSARDFLTCLICYVLEEADEKDRNFATVVKAYNTASYSIIKNQTIPFLDDMLINKPKSLAARRYAMTRGTFCTEKTWASTMMFIQNAISVFEYDAMQACMTKPSNFRFEKMGEEKTALFLNVSDSDRTLDALVSVFYSQAFKTLMKVADAMPDSRLKVPVRIVLDDFATNCAIDSFDKLISVIRSREISTSIILQSLSQLNSIYGESEKLTILNNCDNILYLGGTDLSTVDYIAARADCPSSRVMGLEPGKAYFIQRGMLSAKKVNAIAPYSDMPKKSPRKRVQEPKPEREAELGTEAESCL